MLLVPSVQKFQYICRLILIIVRRKVEKIKTMKCPENVDCPSEEEFK